MNTKTQYTAQTPRPVDVTRVLIEMSATAPALLGDRRQENYVTSYVALMDASGVVYAATSGHNEVADLAYMRMAFGLLSKAAADAPTLSKPYLENALKSLRHALALREDPGKRDLSALH